MTAPCAGCAKAAGSTSGVTCAIHGLVTAPTLAELRAAFLRRCAADQEVHDDSGAEFKGDLDALIAAARAEAFAEAEAIAADIQAECGGRRDITPSAAAQDVRIRIAARKAGTP